MPCPERRPWRARTLALLPALAVLCAALAGCGGGGSGGGSIYDVATKGVPRFLGASYLDLDRIARVSRFRSSEGHDYTYQDVEDCRSMKHYFAPAGGDPGTFHDPSWTTIRIYTPVAGTIERADPELAGTQVWIRSSEYPAFVVGLFHVGLDPALKVGHAVALGQRLGTHGGDETWSDVAIVVNTPEGTRLVSYFDAVTDDVFAAFVARGATARADFVITREARDADPLTCSGDAFLTRGTLESWVVLD